VATSPNLTPQIQPLAQAATTPTIPTATTPTTTPYTPPPTTQPLGLPQASNNFNASTPAPSGPPSYPREAEAPGTFGNVTGNRPYFLPGEDQGGVIQSLMADNILPPFVKRLLAQARGEQSQGTNQPFPFELPKGVPLVSKLGYSQMSPTERAGLDSILSSYGISPEDYLAYVESLSPQGGPSELSPFGTPFRFNRQ
jgi:hypothetical protein